MSDPRAGDESQLQQLVEEQAALRRVATLVAEGAPADTLFALVAEQVAAVLQVPLVSIVRYESDGTGSERASFSRGGEVFRVGTRWSLDGTNVVAAVRDSGRPARIDDYRGLTGEIAEECRRAGIRSRVGIPIVVAGRLWGAMVVSSTEPDVLPAGTEARLADFTALVATAIANGEAREEVERLVAEQAALRRVATLVAKEAPPAEVFAKVADELAHVLGDVHCALFVDEGDGTATAVAGRGLGIASGTRMPVDGNGAVAIAIREGRTARIADYSAIGGAIGLRAREVGIRASVGCPVVVRGRVWGALAVGSDDPEALPPETETRVAQFADLTATAIANAAARAEIERLAEEQAALRRVAMLVAGGAPPAAVFDAVAAEMEGLLRADGVTVSRYEPGDIVTVVANRGPEAASLPAGTRVACERLRGGGSGSVEAPVVVDGRLWGVVTASWRGENSPALGAEERMAQFAELLDTAIGNADAHDQLTASRTRLLTAADEARRRLVRDLHDGAQQRLVHAIVTLKLARQALDAGGEGAEPLVREALAQAQQGNDELRELAHGILPAVLTRGGLRAGLGTVLSRIDLPVEVDVPAERFPAEIEASAYFIVAESLTNVVKHARAASAAVEASENDGVLHVEVRDDGVGGADPEGHGILGMRDRATALGGRLEIESPAGGGTRVVAALPTGHS